MWADAIDGLVAAGYDRRDIMTMPITGVWELQSAVARRQRFAFAQQVNAYRTAMLAQDDYEDTIRKVIRG